MKIDEKLLCKLENLSALNIEEQKREELLKQLNDFVDFINILDSFDNEISNMNTACSSSSTPFRKDEILHSDVVDDVLKHSPKQQDHFFVVPKIIE